MKVKFSLYFLLGVLQCLIAIGAIPAGITFVIDPSGHRSGISKAILENSPFLDFFFPGLFLIVYHGAGNIISAILCFFKHPVSGFLGILFGFILMLWIVLQVYWIGYGSILQPVYFILGGVEAVIGYILLRREIRGD
jgi:hypothetical protein